MQAFEQVPCQAAPERRLPSETCLLARCTGVDDLKSGQFDVVFPSDIASSVAAAGLDGTEVVGWWACWGPGDMHQLPSQHSTTSAQRALQCLHRCDCHSGLAGAERG